MEMIMPKTTPEQNKALVLEAFDTLFNKHDIVAAERFWSPEYIQHSAHIPPGREGLFKLVRSVPDTMRYENQLIVAEGDYVILHGRFSGIGRSVDHMVSVGKAFNANRRKSTNKDDAEVSANA
jgi:predicted SnoaL-like aldol condensation-catalyzing enzyme